MKSLAFFCLAGKEKSRIRETPNLSTNVDSSTATKWLKSKKKSFPPPRPIFFYGEFFFFKLHKITLKFEVTVSECLTVTVLFTVLIIITFTVTFTFAVTVKVTVKQTVKIPHKGDIKSLDQC